MTKLKSRENGQISIPWNTTSRIQRNPTVAPPASRIPFLRSRKKLLPPTPIQGPAPEPEPVKAPPLLEPIAPLVRVRTAIPRRKGTVAEAKPGREAAGPTPNRAPVPAPCLVPIPEELERQTVNVNVNVNPLSEVDKTITTPMTLRSQYGKFGANLLKISAQVEETTSNLKDYYKGIMDSTLKNLEELKKKKKKNVELKSVERKTRVPTFEPAPEPETQEPFHSNHPIPSQLQNEEYRRKNKTKRRRRRQDTEVFRLLITNYRTKGGSGGGSGYEFPYWSTIGYPQDLVTSVKAPYFTRAARRDALNKTAPILPAQAKIPNPKRNVRDIEGPAKSKPKPSPKRRGRGKRKPRKTLIVNKQKHVSPKRNWTKSSKKNMAPARKSKYPPKNKPKAKSKKRKRSQIEAQEDVEDEGISNSAIELVSMFESDNENDETLTTVDLHVDTPAPGPGPPWSRSMNHGVPHNLNFTQLSRSSPLTQLQQGSCSSSCLLPANKKRLLDFDDVCLGAPAQGLVTQVEAVPVPVPVKSSAPLQVTSESAPIPAVVQGQGQGQIQGRRQLELLQGVPPSKPITPIQTRSKKIEITTSNHFIINSFSPNPGTEPVSLPKPETGSVESDVETKTIPIAPVSGLKVTDLEIQDQGGDHEFIEKGIRTKESEVFNMTPISYTPHEEMPAKPETSNGIEVVTQNLKKSVKNRIQNSQSDIDCDPKPTLRSKRKPKRVSVSIPRPDKETEDATVCETKVEGSGSVTADVSLQSEENSEVEEMYFLNSTGELTVLEDTIKESNINITPVPDPDLALVPVPVPVLLWVNQPSPPSPSPEIKEARQTRQGAKAYKEKDTELTSYDMTTYNLEDFDEDGDVTLSHRERKPIPKWARKGKNLTLSLFHQRSELLELVNCGLGLDSDSHCWASVFPPANLKFVTVPKIQRILDLSGLSSSSTDGDSDSDESEGEINNEKGDESIEDNAD